MKKYGQADVMSTIVHIFLEQQQELTDEQKKKIEDQCCDEIMKKYPSAAEWEINI